jgi:hypothetical protein
MTEWEVVRVKDIVGDTLDDAIFEFDLTEVQNVVSKLQSEDVPTLAQAERLCQEALRGADILSEYLAKVHKIMNYLDAKVATTRNKIALDYVPPDGARNSIELRKMAGEASQEVLDLEINLAKVKGAKTLLEKKYDIIIKSHHHYKDIATGLRKTINGYTVPALNDE